MFLNDKNKHLGIIIETPLFFVLFLAGVFYKSSIGVQNHKPLNALGFMASILILRN